MPQRSATFAGVIALALCTASPAFAETWIVDAGGGGKFKSVQAAADAAADGDVLVLRPGHYGSLRISRKGLRVVGCGPALVTLERHEYEGDGPCFSATDLALQQTLVLTGIHCIGRGATLEIARCAGLVALTDLVVESDHPAHAACGPALSQCARAFLVRVAVLPSGMPSAGGANGLRLEDGSYTLTQVVAVGANGAAAKSPFGKGGGGEAGLAISDAQVYTALCEFTGGNGGAALWDQAAPFCPEAATGGIGGSGVYIAGRSEVAFAGDTVVKLRGGDGGAGAKNPWDNCWSYGGQGGSGLRLRAEGQEKHVSLSNQSIDAGRGGIAEGKRAGRAGPAVEGDTASIETSDPTFPTLSMDEPAVSGGSIALRVRGTPGDLVAILVASELGHVKMRGMKGFPLQALPGGLWFMNTEGRVNRDGTLLVQAQLPHTADTLGRALGVQAMLIPPPDSERDTMLSNLEVLCIADGALLAPTAGH